MSSSTLRPALGPFCTEFVYPGCLHCDNGATSRIDDALYEHGGLLNVLPLAVHLKFYLGDMYIDCRQDHFMWDPTFMLKSKGVGCRWVGGGLQDFSVRSIPLGTNLVLELIGVWA